MATMDQMVMALDAIARASDPAPSHQAAAVVKQGSAAMNDAILACCLHLTAVTAFQIAWHVTKIHPDRWDEGSIRTAISRLAKRGLLVKDGQGRSPRGQPCAKYRLP